MDVVLILVFIVFHSEFDTPIYFKVLVQNIQKLLPAMVALLQLPLLKQTIKEDIYLQNIFLKSKQLCYCLNAFFRNMVKESDFVAVVITHKDDINSNYNLPKNK